MLSEAIWAAAIGHGDATDVPDGGSGRSGPELGADPAVRRFLAKLRRGLTAWRRRL
jgi:hypothetical protein